VELHGVTEDGVKLLLVGAAAPGDGELRLFVGRDEHLKEQAVTSLERDLGVAVSNWRFQFDLEGELARVESDALYPDTLEHSEQLPLSGGALSVGDTESVLRPLSRTAMALAGLSFECSALEVDGWRLSNTPPPELTAGTCAAEPPSQFRCLGFIEGDYTTGVTEAYGSAAFRARVSQTGTGLPPANLVGSACRGDAEAALRATPELSLVWAGFERDGREAFIVLRSPRDALNPFALDAEIDVNYRHGGYREEAYTVRGSAGELLLWWSRSLELATVAVPPEATISQGPERCATIGNCAYASQYALELSLGAQPFLLDYGAQVERGGFLAVSGGYSVQTTPTECPDAISSGLNVELWAAPSSG
jgi:hypothetical protein